MRLRCGYCLLAAALMTAPTVLAQQSGSPGASPAPSPAQTPPCSASPQPAPCTAAPAKPASGSTTDRFPFPGEDAAPAPGSDPARSAAPPAPSPAKSFPFPEDEPTPAAPQPSGSTSSSSSSGDPTAFPSDDTNASDPNASPNKADAPSGRRLLKRVNPVGTKLQSPDEREAEDLSIAKFYVQTGDLQGAYKRSQDAVKVIPDDPDAHCMLAQTALKLNKRDEAISEFNACLKLDPVEKEAKNARKELARLK